MAKKKSMSLSQTVEQVLAQVQTPVSMDEIAHRVVKRYPSRANNPLASIRSHLRTNHVGKTLVLLDRKTVVPIPVVMRGVRFRASLCREEVDGGVLLIYPTFAGYRHRGLEQEDLQLFDAVGEPLAARASLMRRQETGLFGPSTYEFPVVELGDWFRTHRVRRDDSILITIEDWQQGCFRLEHEPATQRREADIERQNRELADILFDMLEAERSERMLVHRAIPTAYGWLSDPRGYPGDHWMDVLRDDGRMDSNGFVIYYNDFDAPLEDASPAKSRRKRQRSSTPRSASPARQIYRFKASLTRRQNLWRRVEIRGNQTLANFDSTLRRAFQHDGSDHLGGFWKRVRRGTSTRFREIELGTIDPFGEGDGAEQHIAELGLKPGDELKYVYDFGDWIEHLLTLEEMVEPEAKAKYPRVVAQNKPTYQYCQACKATQRQTVATWVCHACSAGRRRVLLCEACLMDEHEDHYADEIVY
jgi:hypothetical protein